MLNPTTKSSLAAACLLGVTMLFSSNAAVALTPPPPNPSDEQISGASGVKSQAEAQVASASVAVTQMNNQIEALNAQLGVEVLQREDGEYLALFPDRWRVTSVRGRLPDAVLEPLVAT